MARMATESGVTTAEALIRLPGGRWRYELVDGVLRQMTPAGHVHGKIAARICARLTAFVEEQNLGHAYAAETGFLLRRSPDTVRAPDAAFVSAARLEALALSARGYFPGSPDLAIEVLSPDDAAGAVEAKTADWLTSGCVVIIIDPVLAIATVHRPGASVVTLRGRDELTVPDLLPGWAVTVGELFR